MRIEAKNQQGDSVDWWFIYKTPVGTGSKDNKGFDFFYFDPASDSLALSPVGLDQKPQAMAYTLEHVFNATGQAGYLCYNDEHADKTPNRYENGHCKGMLAFDKTTDSSLFLLHSTPRFPVNNEPTLPADEALYGQTFLCISLPDYETANRIAAQMLCQQNPQVMTESSYMPASIAADEPLAHLYNGTGVDESTTPSTLHFQSRGGKDFRLIAKSRKWGQDFWLDLVSPELQSDLIVETWRRGRVTPLEDKRSTTYEEDILQLDFAFGASERYQWSYTKDHAKWAVALKNDLNAAPWVCVADMNRMVSQEKRGGGSLCFQEERLWKALMSAEEKLHRLSGTTDPEKEAAEHSLLGSDLSVGD